jgi:hypothetical protein
MQELSRTAEIVASRAFFTIASTDDGGMAMKDSHESSRSTTRLLDPRFQYTPAAKTDIAATWKRFGFDPNSNEQRRRLLLKRFAMPSGPLAPAPHALGASND